MESEQIKELDTYFKILNEDNDDDPFMVDFNSDEGMPEVPGEWKDFEFESKIIFLSNYPKIPQALKDRCWTLEMIFSNEQIMDIIDRALIKSNPEAQQYDAQELFHQMTVDSADQMDRIAVKKFFIDADAKGLASKQLSFRLFNRLLSLYVSTKHTPKWKTFLMIEMKS
jgi:tyrosyl-tRNA synthetase